MDEDEWDDSLFPKYDEEYWNSLWDEEQEEDEDVEEED